MPRKTKDLRLHPTNPRTITEKRLAQLGYSMEEFGDISGITFNVGTGNVFTGNQRAKNLDKDSEVTYTHKYKQATKDGTVAEGYILHHGSKFNYREVNWPRAKEIAAMHAANNNAGSWDLEQVKLDLKFLDSFDVSFDLKLTMWEDEKLQELKTVTVAEHERSLSNGETDEEIEDSEPPEEPQKLEGQIQLFQGDSLEILKGIAKNTFDSIVTDPPYGWRFMGKAWDGADIEKRAQRERTEKDLDKVTVKVEPNGRVRHLKRKNYDRTAASAGAYDFSSSANQIFQKFSEDWAREAYRVLKPGGYMIVFCGPRTYHRMASGVEDAGFEIRDQLQWLFGSGFPKSMDISKAIDRAERVSLGKNPNGKGSGILTTPATAAAAQWEGWGTALKPANEPILLARKPISEKTVAANVLKWGTGAINIDACRIGNDDVSCNKVGSGGKTFHGAIEVPRISGSTSGRFPANLMLDETAAEILDAQTGISTSPTTGQGVQPCFGDTGGASRFFYVAKASKSEKNTHCRELEGGRITDGRKGIADFPKQRDVAVRANHHPTVKPVSLMRYLCRLITPSGGLILDPFLGSGTTGVAASRENFRFVGIERETDYFQICKKRLNYKHTKVDLVTKIKVKPPTQQAENRHGKKTTSNPAPL